MSLFYLYKVKWFVHFSNLRFSIYYDHETWGFFSRPYIVVMYRISMKWKILFQKYIKLLFCTFNKKFYIVVVGHFADPNFIKLLPHTVHIFLHICTSGISLYVFTIREWGWNCNEMFIFYFLNKSCNAYTKVLLYPPTNRIDRQNTHTKTHTHNMAWRKTMKQNRRINKTFMMLFGESFFL